MCRRCGREACAECFIQVRELTVDRPGASGAEIAALQSRREKHAHSNPFFLSCTKRNEHQAVDFCPVSRFCKDELVQVVKDMERLVAEPDQDGLSDPGIAVPGINGTNGPTPGSSGTAQPDGPLLTIVPADVPDTIHSLLIKQPNGNGDVSISPDMPTPASSYAEVGTGELTQIQSAVPPVPSTDPAEIPCHDTERFLDSELTDDVFRATWAQGRPIVVTGLLSKFKLQWTPEYFIEKYGTQSCLIVECQTDVNKRVTVGEFFSWLGKYEGRTECWKLKVLYSRQPNPSH
jgi:lysine-specific demethylase 3